MRRVGSTVYINAQLIDTETGTNLWGDRFSHQTSSLLDLDDEVTRRLAIMFNDKLVRAGSRHEAGTLAADGNPLDKRMRVMASSITSLHTG